MNRLPVKPLVRLLYLAWVNVSPARPLLDRVMQRTFDDLAPGWHERIADPARLAPLDVALEKLSPTPSRIADLGCGTGAATIELAHRFGASWVLGVDISPAMLEIARSDARDAGAAVQFLNEPIQHTSIDSGSVDLVVLINAPPPFAEIARILSPAGRAVVVFTKGPDTPMYSSATRLRRGFARSGLTEVASGSVGHGEYFAAAHVALPARNPVTEGAMEHAAASRASGVRN